MSILLGCVGILCITGALIAWPIGIWLGWRSVVRVPPGHCHACGYDRSSVGDREVCPECGVGISEAIDRVAPGAAGQAGLRVGALLVTAVASYAIFTFGARSVHVPLLMAMAVAVLGFTAVSAWFAVPFVRRVTPATGRGFVIASILFYGVVVLFSAATLRPGASNAGQMFAVMLFVHTLGLSFLGWIVLFNAGVAASERRGPPPGAW